MNDSTSEPDRSTSDAPAAPTTRVWALGNYLLLFLGGAVVVGIAEAGAQRSVIFVVVGVIFVVGCALYGAWLARQRNRGTGDF